MTWADFVNMDTERSLHPFRIAEVPPAGAYVVVESEADNYTLRGHIISVVYVFQSKRDLQENREFVQILVKPGEPFAEQLAAAESQGVNTL